jgi:deoxyribodipyrimidine photo-lyase
MLSPRQALAAALDARRALDDTDAQEGVDTWINELIWREFYTAILYHFPDVLKTAFNPALRDIPWREAPDDLAAWQAGLTGYPVVDAYAPARATGDNRRMISASFLVKDLLVNWQEGERWFMQMLVDGDPAANNSGWQWTAGVGTDAAPYVRVFNPVLQGMKFDPKGAYVRRWLPELANVPDDGSPSPGYPPVYNRCGFKTVKLPPPIADHAAARHKYCKASGALTELRPPPRMNIF